MEIKQLTKAEYRQHPESGVPMLYVEFDGRQIYIWYEQRLLEYGLVYIGLDDFQAVLPADPADGRERPQKVSGFTNDIRLLALARGYIQVMDEGAWKPGLVPIPPGSDG